jgi:hypothetical protein
MNKKRNLKILLKCIPGRQPLAEVEFPYVQCDLRPDQLRALGAALIHVADALEISLEGAPDVRLNIPY